MPFNRQLTLSAFLSVPRRLDFSFDKCYTYYCGFSPLPKQNLKFQKFPLLNFLEISGTFTVVYS